MANTFLNINPSLGGGSGGGFVSPADQALDMGPYNILFSGGNSTWTVIPAGPGIDDAPAINAAMYAAKLAGGGVVQLINGNYVIKTDIDPTGSDYMCGVVLRGMTDTVLSVEANLTEAAFNLEGSGFSAKALNNISAGATSVTLTTASDAAVVKAGGFLVIRGIDTDGKLDFEVHEASADGNSGTGIVTLSTPILKTMTSVTLELYFGSEANTVSAMDNGLENLTIELNHALAASRYAIRITGQQNFSLKNVTIRGWENNPAGNNAITLDSHLFLRAENVRVLGSTDSGISVGYAFRSTLLKCFVQNVGIHGIRLALCYDTVVDECYIDGCDDSGIEETISNSGRRNEYVNNIVMGCGFNGIHVGFDKLVQGNIVERCINTRGIFGEGDRVVIDGNILRNCKFSVQIIGKYGQVLNNRIITPTSFGIILSVDADDGIISNNDILSAPDSGIVVSDSDRVVVANNVVRSCGDMGISIASASLNCAITGNVCSNNTNQGIKVSNDSTGTTVNGNNCNGDGISLGTGANNVASGNIDGGFQLATRSVAGNVSTSEADQVIFVDTAAARTITLSTADVQEGRQITIKDSTGGATVNNITIDTQGAELINGAATASIILNYASLTVISDGTNWFTI